LACSRTACLETNAIAPLWWPMLICISSDLI
jgi:hypothetical protein